MKFLFFLLSFLFNSNKKVKARSSLRPDEFRRKNKQLYFCNKRHKNVVNTSRPMLRWVRIFILIARNELSFFQASTFFSSTGKMFSFSSFSPTFSSLYIFKILAWLIKDMSPGKSLKFIICANFRLLLPIFHKMALNNGWIGIITASFSI